MIMKEPTDEEEFFAFTEAFENEEENNNRVLYAIARNRYRLVSFSKGFCINLIFKFQRLLKGFEPIN